MKHSAGFKPAEFWFLPNQEIEFFLPFSAAHVISRIFAHLWLGTLVAGGKMALNANYYITPKTDQKIIIIMLRASFSNCESSGNVFFFQKKGEGKL